jgi:Heparinase II/III-like protein
MNRRRILSLSLLPFSRMLFAATGKTGSDQFDPLLGITLKPHPRLICTDERIEQIRKLIKQNPSARELYDDLVESAQRTLSEPPVEYKLIGSQLLDKSRTCLAQMRLFAFLWRLDRKQEYFSRAMKELNAAASFPDWRPSHFLDTAEMTHAFALGYDWLFPDLPPADRDRLAKAVLDKGLASGLKAYAEKASWLQPNSDWNQVCNGGLGLGALAVGDVYKNQSNSILNSSITSLLPAMELYSPDGGWIEGPDCWEHATEYAAAFLASLDTTLHRDYELSNAAGFDHAGDFRLHCVGPSGLQFNFADAGEKPGAAPSLNWLAARFDRQVYGWQQRTLTAVKGAASPLDLIWFQEKLKTPDQAQLPLAAQFRGPNVGFLRTSWSDPNALFVGAKGGDNKANHAHLDLGSFVFDALGVRWATDLGADDDNLPEYFGKKRWSYYRLRTESHNTLLIDQENQSENAKAALHLSSDFMEIELTKAYADRLRSWRRQLSLLDGKSLRIIDSIEASRPVEVLWGMVTRAKAEVQGRQAILQQAGKTMTAFVESPDEARFDLVSTHQAPPQNPNNGTTKLVVRLPNKVQRVRLEVQLAVGAA